MTPAFLCKVGEALRGPAWRAAMADPLGVKERTIRRWANEESPIPSGLPADLASLCRKHAAKLIKLAETLEKESANQ